MPQKGQTSVAYGPTTSMLDGVAGSLERNVAPGWQTYAQAFRLVVRIDGQPAWSKPITPTEGPTMSWAVTLASR